jgi:hypothetical protein
MQQMVAILYSVQLPQSAVDMAPVAAMAQAVQLFLVEAVAAAEALGLGVAQE